MQLVVEAVTVDVDVDAGGDDGDGAEAAVEAEVEVEERQRTECRNIDWHYRFCPTTPGALQQHCCCLKSKFHRSILSETGPLTGWKHKKSQKLYSFLRFVDVVVTDLLKISLESTWLKDMSNDTST